MKKILIGLTVILTVTFAGQSFASNDPYCMVTKNTDDRTGTTLRYVATDLIYGTTNANCQIVGEGLNFTEAGFADKMVLFQTKEILEKANTTGNEVREIVLNYTGGTPIEFYPMVNTVIGNRSADVVNAGLTEYTENTDLETFLALDNPDFGLVVIDGAAVTGNPPLTCASSTSADVNIYLRNMVLETTGYTKDEFLTASSCFADGGEFYVCNGQIYTSIELNTFKPNTYAKLSDWCNCNNKVWLYYDNDGDGYGVGEEQGSDNGNGGINPGEGPFGKKTPMFDQSNFPTSAPVPYNGSPKSFALKKPGDANFGSKLNNKFKTIDYKPPVQVCAEEVSDYPDYVEQGGDCDDEKSTVNPGAEDICDGIDNDCDGQIDEDAGAGTECYDDDGDGYSETDGDCDDSDASVNPGADEVCGDGVDNNCDGVQDQSTTWYADSDTDGYGDANNAIESCDTPAGYVVNDSDCDDADADISPAATEECDTIDNDCDGSVDEGDVCGVVSYDEDGDGYDSIESGGDDCDDTDATVNPGATDICGDGIDNNCAGADRECAPEICNDTTDNDEDGLTDCEDTDCGSWYECNDLDQELDCSDDTDNEGDGYTDCEDADCMFDADCTGDGTETVCDDGIDNDHDGLTDGDDEDCADADIIPVDPGAFLSGGGGCACNLKSTTQSSANNLLSVFAIIALACLMIIMRRKADKKS